MGGIVPRPPATLCLFALFVPRFCAKLDLDQATTTPSTRSRGQIGCYSCVSLAGHRSNGSPKHPGRQPKSAGAAANVSEFKRMFTEAGMRMPKVVGRCAETNPTARPNFMGAEIRVCENSEQRPGACVKLKGFYRGSWFVFRDCWSRMWLDPRPYQHILSGRCYSDELVQNFVASERNVICFCEEDLCNGAAAQGNAILATVAALLVLVFG